MILKLALGAAGGLLGCGAAPVLAQSSCPTITPLAGTGQVTTSNYYYDANGNLTSSCDPNSQLTTVAYDALNRPTTVTEPVPGASGSNPVISTTYDERDQVTQVTDPRNLMTKYTVDGLGNLTLQTSPDTGGTTNTYDALGHLKTSTDARGKVTTYGYDALNRVSSISYSSGTATAFTYDGAPSPVQYDIGHLTGISDESGSTRLYYDGFGRVLKKVQTSGTGTNAQTQTVQYTYSESGSTTGHLTSLTYPSGAVANYSYDAAGRVAGISLTLPTSTGTTSVTLLSSVTYNPFGAAKGWTWGNGSVYARSFDEDGRLAAYPLGSTSGTVTPNGLTRTVAYDGASRVTGFTHADTSGNTQSAVALAANATFGYDHLDRLTGYTPATTAQNYTYDLTGNRTSTVIGANTYTDTIASTSNQLSATNGPPPNRTNAYDADGNLTGDGTYTYGYSARGRLASTTAGSNVTSYLYNGLGQRVYKAGPTSLVASGINHYVYDEAGHLLGEYDTNAQSLQETVYLGDTPVGIITTNGPALVVDNTNASQTTVVGTWSTSNGEPNYQGSNYQYHTPSSGTDSFTWKLAITSSGSYDVYARWTADTSRSTAATYQVGSNAVVHENQTTNGGKWVLLGTYTLASGTTNVKLTTDSSGYVIADAVKAVLATQDGMTGYYIYPDQIDTPRMVTRPSDDQMVWRWDEVDPFGAAVANSNPAGLGAFTYNPRFPGQLFDAENNLNYNWNRNYNPAIGGYTSSDPLGLGGGSMTTYGYAAGNPLSYADPTGLFVPPAPVVVPVAAAAGEAGGGALGAGSLGPVGLAGLGGVGIGLGFNAAWNAVAGQPFGGSVYDFFNPGPSMMQPPSPSPSPSTAPTPVITNGDDPASAKGLGPQNPGKDCDGKCKPCPPNQVWGHPGDAHGSTGGAHYHGIVWNQTPDCRCFPRRVSGPTPYNMR